MNTLIDNVRYTVKGIFDLYTTVPFKKLFTTGIVYFLWANIFCVALAGGILYLLSALFSYEFSSTISADGTVLGFLSSQRVLGLVQALLVLSLSVLGIAMMRYREKDTWPRANVVDILELLETRERRLFLQCIILILIVHAVPLEEFYEPGVLDMLVYETEFYSLFLDLAILIRTHLLPCFLSMTIIMYSLWGRISVDIVREYRVAYISGLMILFGLNAVLFATIDLASGVLFRPLMVIPLDSFVETAWSIAITILYGLVFLATLGIYSPALSLSFALPFYGEEERLASLEEEEQANAGINRIDEDSFERDG